MQQMGQDQPQKQDRFKQVGDLLRNENYDVVRTEMTQDDPLPPKFDLMLVIGPQNLSDRQRYEINKALVSGKDVVMAVQNYKFNYMPQQGAGIKVAVSDLLRNQFRNCCLS